MAISRPSYILPTSLPEARVVWRSSVSARRRPADRSPSHRAWSGPEHLEQEPVLRGSPSIIAVGILGEDLTIDLGAVERDAPVLGREDSTRATSVMGSRSASVGCPLPSIRICPASPEMCRYTGSYACVTPPARPSIHADEQAHAVGIHSGIDAKHTLTGPPPRDTSRSTRMSSPISSVTHCARLRGLTEPVTRRHLRATRQSICAGSPSAIASCDTTKRIGVSEFNRGLVRLRLAIERADRAVGDHARQRHVCIHLGSEQTRDEPVVVPTSSTGPASGDSMRTSANRPTEPTRIEPDIRPARDRHDPAASRDDITRDRQRHLLVALTRIAPTGRCPSMMRASKPIGPGGVSPRLV